MECAALAAVWGCVVACVENVKTTSCSIELTSAVDANVRAVRRWKSNTCACLRVPGNAPRDRHVNSENITFFAAHTNTVRT